MSTEAERLREDLSICRKAPRFSRYPPAIRREAMRYVKRRSKQGLRPKHLAEELGVSQTTVADWLKATSEEQATKHGKTPQTSQAVSFKRIELPAEMRNVGHDGSVVEARDGGVSVQLSLSDGATVRAEGMTERGAVQVLIALGVQQR